MSSRIIGVRSAHDNYHGAIDYLFTEIACPDNACIRLTMLSRRASDSSSIDVSPACGVGNGRIHHTKCEMLVSLVPGGSLSLVAVCQVSHKLAPTRDARVTPSKGRIMKEAHHSGGERVV